MALYYTYGDLEIGSGDTIKKADLNRRYRKLVENDVSIFPSGHIPTVWERKWYNNDNIEGYSKGDAVWVNTESEYEFIVSRSYEIYNYARNNSLLNKSIAPLNTMDPASVAVYRNIVRGFTDRTTGQVFGCLYYLGDIEKPVQIRVCTVEHGTTKTTPDDDRYWKDFFIPNVGNEDTLSSEIYDAVDLQFESHLSGYHTDKTFSDISATYLGITLDNIPPGSLQRYNRGMTRPKSITGFDYIKCSSTRIFPGGGKRWFRLWNSGYLEHGGTIMTTSPSGFETSVYEGTCLKVMLNWRTEDGMTAPVYEFPGLGVGEFYQDCNRIMDVGIGYSSTGNVSRDNRYTVSVCPVDVSDVFPGFGGLDNMSVNTMNNDSFTFTLSPSYTAYSFSVGGWTSSRVSTVDQHVFPTVYSEINDQDHWGTVAKIIMCYWRSDINAAGDMKIVDVPAMGTVNLNDYIVSDIREFTAEIPMLDGTDEGNQLKNALVAALNLTRGISNGSLEFDMTERTIFLRYDSTQVTRSRIMDTLRAAGSAFAGFSAADISDDSSGDEFIFVGWYLDGGTWNNPVPSVWDSVRGERVCEVEVKKATTMYHARFVKEDELLDIAFTGDETSFTISDPFLKMTGEKSATASFVVVDMDEEDA